MAHDYTKNQATAKRLIEKYGRDVALHRKSDTPLDSAKPWRGPNPATATLVGTVKAAIFPYDEENIDGTLIRRGDERAWVAYTSLTPPAAMEKLDTIIDGTIIYGVIKVNIIKPGDLVVAYEIQVRR